MIAYEELERALVRWKARRSGAGAGESPPVAAIDDIPSGIIEGGGPASDSTGELEIGDAAIIDEG
jgi:hypothetical protein